MYDNSFTLNLSGKYSTSLLKELFVSCENSVQNTLVLVWGSDDCLLYLSDQVEDYFQTKKTTILSLKWTELLPPSIVEEVNHHFNYSDTQMELTPFHFPNDADKDRIMKGFIAPMFLKEHIYYMCQLTDTSFVEELKDLLVDTEKLLLANQLTASLVHEIRNPLTSLKGFLQLVQSGVEQREEYYRVIVAEIEKLEKITSELLQMSRPKKQEKAIHHAHHLIEDVLFLIKTQVDMRNVDFDMTLEKHLTVECHASQIKQVLMNIIKNGAEAMDKQGKIQIEAVQEDHHVVIHITDEGKGISNEAVAELKNPFYTTKQDGTGLGLVVTEHILEAHDGHLHVDSQENKGTRFSIVLPKYGAV